VVLSPGSSQLEQISTYLFTIARYDQDYDVRDRGRFLHALLRGVRSEKIETQGGDDDGVNGAQKAEKAYEDDEAAMGGVILRREQVKLVLLGRREDWNDLVVSGERHDFMSRAELIEVRSWCGV
jgi:AP-3 complex subunit beta